jgi:hypothetical protein
LNSSHHCYDSFESRHAAFSMHGRPLRSVVVALSSCPFIIRSSKVVMDVMAPTPRTFQSRQENMSSLNRNTKLLVSRGPIRLQPAQTTRALSRRVLTARVFSKDSFVVISGTEQCSRSRSSFDAACCTRCFSIADGLDDVACVYSRNGICGLVVAQRPLNIRSVKEPDSLSIQHGVMKRT